MWHIENSLYIVDEPKSEEVHEPARVGGNFIRPGRIKGPELLNDARVRNRALVNQAAARLAIAHTLPKDELRSDLALHDPKQLSAFKRVVSYLVRGELAVNEAEEGSWLSATPNLYFAVRLPDTYPELATNIQILKSTA